MSSIKDQSRFSRLEAEQIQPRQHYRLRKQKHRILLVITILFIVGGALWISNDVGVIPGPWSGIFAAFFAVLSVVLTLPPLFSLAPRETPGQTTTSPVVTQSQPHRHAPLEDVNVSVDEHRGALIVYVKRHLRGSTINLNCGFNSIDLKVDAASSVIERRKSGDGPFLWRLLRLERVVFVAIFPALKPGNYTVYTESREFVNRVTIYAEQITEIDWR